MPQPKNNYYAHGKLLLSGEYFILDGAWGVALPTHPGQHLSVTATDTNHLEWKSLDADGTPWLEATFDLESLRFMAGTDAQIGENWNKSYEKFVIYLLVFYRSPMATR
jgi:mevalonate kinase